MRYLSIVGSCMVLVALTWIAYTPVWKNGLVDFDDELYISDNPEVMDGLSWSGVRWAFKLKPDRGNYWQPLPWLTLQADTTLFPERTRDGLPSSATVAAVHAQNLFWHTASTLLLFALVRRMTGARFAGFVVAGLFAVHPMHVESVAWAAERKDVLSVFFGLVTLHAYVWYTARPSLLRYTATAGGFALSLMCKPMLMTLPFVLLLLDYWPLQRMLAQAGRSESGPHALSFTWLVLEKLPFLLLAAAGGVFTLIARRQADAIVSFDTLPLSARLGTAATAYGWYVGHTLWPTNLAALYPHRGRDWEVAPAAIGLVVLTLFSALAIWQVRRRPWLFVGWFWFVGTLVPVIGLAQGGEQAWADRFGYWPHIGLFIVIVWGLGELVERIHLPSRLTAGFTLVVLGVLVYLTWIQVGYWGDTRKLWQRALDVTTDNDVAHVHLGGYYNSLLVPEKAELHFAEAVRIQPDNGVFRNYLGETLLREGKVEDAMKHLEVAVKRMPELPPAWRALGMARMRLRQPSGALECFRELVRLMPDSADALAALGWAQWESGLRSAAVESFQAALQMDPKKGEAWHGLGIAHLTAGRLNDAVEALNKALQFNPLLVRACSDLGVAFGRQGDWSQALSRQQQAGRTQKQVGIAMGMATAPFLVPEDWPEVVTYACRLAYAHDQLHSPSEAIAAYGLAFRIDPEWPRKFAAKAWRLATDPDPDHRDPQTAFELAAQATASSTDPSPDTLDALSASQAALGRFSEAVETAKRALAKAEAANHKSLARTIRDHLKCYESNRPVLRSAADSHSP